MLVSLRTKRTDAEFYKFWNQLVSEVSELDIEETTLIRKGKISKRFDEVASHHLYKYRKIYIAGRILKHMMLHEEKSNEKSKDDE